MSPTADGRFKGILVPKLPPSMCKAGCKCKGCAKRKGNK